MFWCNLEIRIGRHFGSVAWQWRRVVGARRNTVASTNCGPSAVIEAENDFNYTERNSARTEKKLDNSRRAVMARTMQDSISPTFHAAAAAKRAPNFTAITPRKLNDIVRYRWTLYEFHKTLKEVRPWGKRFPIRWVATPTGVVLHEVESSRRACIAKYSISIDLLPKANPLKMKLESNIIIFFRFYAFKRGIYPVQVVCLVSPSSGCLNN